jgi:DNA-binding MarR family transcriptional regulator
MNDTTPPFTQLIGQTEKSMNAILDRLLAGDVTEPQWVTLVLIAGRGGSADRDDFTGQVAHALKVDQETAAKHISQLAAKGLVLTAPTAPGAGSAVRLTEAGSAVTLTEAGQLLLQRVKQQTGEVTQRLWGDLPAADLDVAGRVLSTVLERAEAELATRS